MSKCISCWCNIPGCVSEYIFEWRNQYVQVDYLSVNLCCECWNIVKPDGVYPVLYLEGESEWIALQVFSDVEYFLPDTD